MRIILNNVLKVTLDIGNNVFFFFFFTERAAARISYEFIYNLRIVGSETFHVLQENLALRILSRPPGILF